MAPSCNPGEILVVGDVRPEDIKPGNIVVFRNPDDGKIIAHRVISTGIGENGLIFVTRGDNSPVPDGTVEAGNIIGKVVGKYRNKKVVPVSRLEELLYLRCGGLYRLTRKLCYKSLGFLMTLPGPRISLCSFPFKRVIIAGEEKFFIFSKVIAKKYKTPEGFRQWIHPLFRQVVKPVED